jgi:hypothetical protein
MTSAINRHALQALIALDVLLALALAALWLTPQGQPRNLQWQPPAAQTADYAAMVPALPGSAPADTRQFIALLERPLFSVTRRPPPPPPPPEPVTKVPEPPDTLATARLLGTFTGAGEGGVIIDLAGKQRRVHLREQLEGWTLSAVQEREATFTSGPRSRTLPLQRAALTTGAGPQQLPVPPAARPVLPQPQPAQQPQPQPAQPQPPEGKPRPRAGFGGSAV